MKVKRIFSLRTKLSLSYMLVALILVSVIGFLTNYLMENQFKNYVMKQQEQRNKDTVSLIGKQYNGIAKEWNDAGVESIGLAALTQGLIVKVTDSSGNVVWDANMHNNGMCTAMLEHMASNTSSCYPGMKGGYVEANYPLTLDFAKIGNVDIGYYGPFYFTDNDLAFVNTLNKLLLGVGIFALLFALILGTVMAKRLSSPISRVITSARQIAGGYFGDRILDKSGTREIGQLTSTINDLAETLEKQDTLRKRLTADVAHELRTPLATLQSHLEAMIDGIWEPDTRRLKSCHEEIMRINRMVGDLEKLARYESENLVLNKSEFDVSELTKSILSNFETEFSSKGIKLTFQGQPVKVAADSDKISQVLINLLSNALKYTPDDGLVEVKVNTIDNAAEIIVADNGSGIHAEDLPYIFERFYRADKSRNRMTGGSGIGLAIVKSIIDAHKGKIEVQSELGKGTSFRIILPLK